MKAKKLMSNVLLNIMFYNQEKDKDSTMARALESKLGGYSSCAEIFGYVIYFRHKNDLPFKDIESVSLAKDGVLLYDFKDLTDDSITALITKLEVV